MRRIPELTRYGDLELKKLCRAYSDKLDEIYRELRRRAIISSYTVEEITKDISNDNNPSNNQRYVDIEHI